MVTVDPDRSTISIMYVRKAFNNHLLPVSITLNLILHLILNNNSRHYDSCNEDTCVERSALLDMVALEQYLKYVFLHLFFIAVNLSSHAKCELISLRKSLSCA